MKLAFLLLAIITLYKSAYSESSENVVNYYTNLISEWKQAAYKYELPKNSKRYAGDDSTTHGMYDYINIYIYIYFFILDAL